MTALFAGWHQRQERCYMPKYPQLPIWQQIVNTLEVSDPPPPQMEVSATLSIALQVLKEMEWVKDGLYIFSGRKTVYQYMSLTPE